MKRLVDRVIDWLFDEDPRVQYRWTLFCRTVDAELARHVEHFPV